MNEVKISKVIPKERRTRSNCIHTLSHISVLIVLQVRSQLQFLSWKSILVVAYNDSFIKNALQAMPNQWVSGVARKASATQDGL